MVIRIFQRYNHLEYLNEHKPCIADARRTRRFVSVLLQGCFGFVNAPHQIMIIYADNRLDVGGNASVNNILCG
jgi:hypothetical protein